MDQVKNEAEKRRLAASFAPALRASQKRDGRFPLVRYVADLSGLEEKTLEAGLIMSKLDENATWKDCAALDRTDVLSVTGLGAFVVAEDMPAMKSRLEQLGLDTQNASYAARELPSHLRMFAKIVIVTGSAQGFGEGIAKELAKQGAHLVIADLNLPLAETVAADLNDTYGSGTAIACGVNVSDESSVEDMVNDTVLYFGGLDLLVSNAGVLRAGGLEEMDVKSFEFVTKINYTAYFICTKYATRPMKIQNKISADSYGDIIQINSKSGLEGSNRNFAYAGGKFGGIGLTQSFAKELVSDRIKVNSVCPGNFYEGPLWSDPEKGLFKQYLEAGKVEGAKSVEDVYNFYINQVPMRKGCSPLDVARAIFYLVEQENETGQAVPITGGQVMLN